MAGIEQNPVTAYGLLNVLDLLRPQVLETDVEFPLDLTVDRARDADAARFGQALQPRRDIDPVAIDVVAIDDHFAQIDANAVLDPLPVRRAGIVSRQFTLDADGAIDSGNHADEVGQHRIARVMHDAPAGSLDPLRDQIEAGRKLPMRGDFIRAGQPAVARYIGVEDRGQFASNGLVRHQAQKPPFCKSITDRNDASETANLTPAIWSD